MKITRLGQAVEAAQCAGGKFCPQILQIDQDFAAVGEVVTEKVSASLPPGPGIGPNEAVVRIPYRVMVAAIPDLLKSISVH